MENDRDALIAELTACRETLAQAETALAQAKKDMRRAQVQLDALKTENEEFKRKFAMIENSVPGAAALKVYRALREFRRRRV